MQHVLTSIRRIPVALRTGAIAAVLLLGYVLWSISGTPSPSTQAPSTGSNTTIPATNQPLRLASTQATAQPQSTTAAETASLQQRYLDVAQQAVQSSGRQGNQPAQDRWGVRIVETDQGRTVIVTMPIHQADSNMLIVRDTKASITKIVNALFVDDPSLIRAGVVSTYSSPDGTEVPGVSVIVRYTASRSWGAVPLDELERIAQSVYVHPLLLSE